MTEHGSARGYRSGCRCADCHAAQNRRNRRYLAARWEYTRVNGGPPATVKHGLSCYMMWGCRCDECRGAMAAWRRKAKEAS